jgi:hypothetical protein
MAHPSEPVHLHRLDSQPSRGEEPAPPLGRRSRVGWGLDAGGLPRTRDSDPPSERSRRKDTTSRLPRPPLWLEASEALRACSLEGQCDWNLVQVHRIVEDQLVKRFCSERRLYRCVPRRLGVRPGTV